MLPKSVPLKDVCAGFAAINGDPAFARSAQYDTQVGSNAPTPPGGPK